MTNSCKPEFLDSPAYGGVEQNQIAYKRMVENDPKSNPGLIWCGGLKSDMNGTKASALHGWAQTHELAFIRFDYFGHGASTGRFRDGTISRWAQDTVQVIDELTSGPQILIGSSMGGWTALLASLARPERIAALVLLAPAPDFTEKLMWASFGDDIRRTIMKEGIYYEPSDYDEPYEISRELILDGRKNLLLDGPININVPVRIIQGQQDTSVPWQYALKLTDALKCQNVVVHLIKDGDHSLSRPQDIARLQEIISDLL